MSGGTAKRFYERAEVVATDAGFGIALDGRPVRTPGGKPLVVARHALADALADEWMRQGTDIVPGSMHLTRLANTAIERLPAAMDEVRADIAHFAGTDLLCYRAGAPEALVARQRAAWDPPLAWASDRFGVEFQLAEGVMAVEQPAELAPAVVGEIAALPALELAALHQVTTLTGSAILALALLRGFLSADATWSAAHVDEDHQIMLWGEDEEATARRARRRAEFDAAVVVLASS